MAIASPNQLWKLGSTILYRDNAPARSVMAMWTISPRQPSVIETTIASGSGAASGSAKSGESGRSRRRVPT
jgi:hypothetical protein